MLIERTVESPLPREKVFDYLADFENTVEWDPGTESTTRASGDGGVGTTYRNVSTFLGRQTKLTYTLKEARRPELLRFQGVNKTVVADDTMRLEPTASGGTRLIYRADFSFKGLARFVSPLLAPAFKRLGDEAETSLRRVLQ